MKILVTGGAGFVGRSLCKMLISHGYTVHVALRYEKDATLLSEGIVPFIVGDIDGQTDWSSAIAGCEIVLHLAARVHVIRESASDPLAAFRKTNTEATVHLAKEAEKAGVRRLVFVSTIHANGNETFEKPFSSHDKVAPRSFYAISKHEAETELLKISGETGMEVVIIRPPLIYGANVRGNFGTLMHVLKKRWPLPLGMVTKNRRSFVALGNLVDFLMTCMTHPDAPGHVFLVSDGEDISTADLLKRLGNAMGTPPLLLPVPPALLQLGAALTGKKHMVQQLLGSLQIDISETRKLLGWNPPFTVDEGMHHAAKPFLGIKKQS